MGRSIVQNVVRRFMAMEHPTEDALKKYLHDHPDADPKNHHVKEQKAMEPKSKKPGRVSIDAVVTFEHNGESFKGKVKKTQWNGPGKPMTYTWEGEDGKTFTTEGTPKNYKVVDDVPSKYRR